VVVWLDFVSAMVKLLADGLHLLVWVLS
jgi:hypothetical protein